MKRIFKTLNQPFRNLKKKYKLSIGLIVTGVGLYTMKEFETHKKQKRIVKPIFIKNIQDHDNNMKKQREQRKLKRDSIKWMEENIPKKDVEKLTPQTFSLFMKQYEKQWNNKIFDGLDAIYDELVNPTWNKRRFGRYKYITGNPQITFFKSLSSDEIIDILKIMLQCDHNKMLGDDYSEQCIRQAIKMVKHNGHTYHSMKELFSEC